MVSQQLLKFFFYKKYPLIFEQFEIAVPESLRLSELEKWNICIQSPWTSAPNRCRRKSYKNELKKFQN